MLSAFGRPACRVLCEHRAKLPVGTASPILRVVLAHRLTLDGSARPKVSQRSANRPYAHTTEVTSASSPGTAQVVKLPYMTGSPGREDKELSEPFIVGVAGDLLDLSLSEGCLGIISALHGSPAGHMVNVCRRSPIPGGSTPGLSHGDPGIFLGGGQTEKFVHLLRNNRHNGDVPSNQPKVAGVFPQRNVGLEVNLSLSLSLVPIFLSCLPFCRAVI